METKYIVNNVTGQTITGDLTINGNVTITGTTNTRPYKVYTALLTQSGGDDPKTITGGTVTVGVTYQLGGISPIGSWDFSNVGGPIYPDTYTFVATASEEPNSWVGVDDLNYNTAAPVVTVLENTIGNIWFTYNNMGHYSIYSDGLFTSNKTFNIIGKASDGDSTVNSGYASTQWYSTNIVDIAVSGFDYIVLDNALNITPIEIRVYN